MQLKHFSLIWVLFLIIGASTPSYALRCQNGLVQDGDLKSEVIAKCGSPASKEVEPPQSRGGRIIKGAVTIERWIYGPMNGAYYYLRFIDGKLVDEDIKVGL
ncbi:DUF2845 domain-containing protein [Salinicola endophyticus]|uniref:DUF2845 domain-containing protein n=1 Tax=Salinicola endophyticus TaxID=1949083 RepID=A0AB74U9B4_9GAMM